VSDTKVSGGIISADSTTLKMEPFHKDWMAMMAADDLTQCVPIIEKAKEYFKARKNTLQVARSVFKRAFRQHLIEMQEDAVLGRYDLSLEKFKKSGKRIFTEKKYDSLCEDIEAVDPKCEFIIHGFDDNGIPHVFHVGGAGVDGVYDKPGFCAIGSGKWAAEVVLYSLGQSIDRDLHSTIFNVCAAKFMAEKSDGVGQATYLFARKHGSTMFSHNHGMIEAMREAWERGGAPKVPDGIVQQMKDGWHPHCG
jgi:hypothetical protein